MKKADSTSGSRIMFSVGKERLLNCIYNSRDKLRELMQRWDNALAMEGLSYIEAYIEGRLTLLCDFDWRGSYYRMEFFIATDANLGVDNFIVPLPFAIDTMQGDNRNNWGNQEVFILNVKVVESKERGTLTSNVRLYRVYDSFNDSSTRSLQFSTIDRCYKIISRLSSKWKFSVPVGNPSALSDDVTCKKIESCSQIMDCITNNERNLAMYLFGTVENQRACPIIRIDLCSQDVKVSLAEVYNSSLKLVDVMVGPFDL